MKPNLRQIIISLLTATALFVGCATEHQRAELGHAGWTCWQKSAGGNDHWYKAVLVTNGISWDEANVLARRAGGYLATITSAAENDFVFSLINSPKYFRSWNGAGPHIGGFQEKGAHEPDGGWSWVTGETWSYSNWHSDEPDNWIGPHPEAGVSEDRLHYFSGIAHKTAATWNDVMSFDANMGGYVIERNQ